MKNLFAIALVLSITGVAQAGGWGAIAYRRINAYQTGFDPHTWTAYFQPSTYRYGSRTGMSSERRAVEGATASCGSDNCAWFSFRNQCGGLALYKHGNANANYGYYLETFNGMDESSIKSYLNKKFSRYAVVHTFAACSD